MFSVRYLGRQQPYQTIWQKMQDFTTSRHTLTADEIWFCEHTPTFTLGRQGKREHILRTSEIPIIQVDRGGHVTYHGPGQLMIYLLLDLKRHQLGAKQFVCTLEQTVIDLLRDHGITAVRRPGAPGLYADDAKIASIGLRIRNGKTYHGICLNVDGDLSPFDMINPCGYEGLTMTQIADHQTAPEYLDLITGFMAHFGAHLRCDWQPHDTGT